MSGQQVSASEPGLVRRRGVRVFRRPARHDPATASTPTTPEAEDHLEIGDDEQVEGLAVRLCSATGELSGLQPARSVARLRELGETAGEHGGFVWVDVADPDTAAVAVLHRAFALPAKAVLDAGRTAAGTTDRHRLARPHVRMLADATVVVVKSCWYRDHPESRGIAEIEDDGDCVVVLGPAWVLTVRHGRNRDLARLPDLVDRRARLLARGPGGVLVTVLDGAVGSYGYVADEVQVDVDELADEVFEAAGDPPVEKAYRMKRELTALRGAVNPLVAPLARLADTPSVGMTDPVRAVVREVVDQLERVQSAVGNLDSLLDSVDDACQAQVSLQQNDDMRKISAWVAMAAVPTLLAGVYGMNFEHMPELGWRFGYPIVVAVMLVIVGGLYVNFKRRSWL